MKLFSALFTTAALLSLSGTQDLAAQVQPDGRPAVDKEKTESRHEIVPYIRGGISTLQYDIDNGSRSSGFGVGVGVNYVWFFQPRWGLQTGIEWQSYNTSARLNPQEFRQTLQYEDFGSQGLYQMDFVSNVKNFHEKQRVGYL